LGTITTLDRPTECKTAVTHLSKYEGWNFNSGTYLFTTDTK